MRVGRFPILRASGVAVSSLLTAAIRAAALLVIDGHSALTGSPGAASVRYVAVSHAGPLQKSWSIHHTSRPNAADV
jgi:hypothetical protein